MFNNLKIILINDNEILAFNENVAGIFSTYRSTSNNAIHQKEERKLTEKETEEFLDELHKNPEEFKGSSKEVDDVMDKIVKYYPEVKYIVHGLNLVEARRSSKEERKDKKLLKDKLKEKEAKKEERRAKEGRKPLQTKKEGGKPKEKSNEESKKEPKESGVKLLEDEKDSSKEAQEKWDEERERWQSPQEKEISKVGKENYTGFKGLLFNIFKNFADPAKKADKEKLLRRLKRDWGTYKKNEKFLIENKELIDALEDRLGKKEISPESILLMNELIARNPELVKEIDFDVDISKYDVEVPVDTLVEYKILKKDSDDATIIQKMKEWAKKNSWDLQQMTIHTDARGRKTVKYRANDLDTFVEMAHKTGGKDLEIKKAG